MEQKDYLLREIEKIGLMISMLLEKIRHKEGKEEATYEEQENEVSGWLKKEMGFEIADFNSLPDSEEEPYLRGLHGFSSPNLELLGDLLMAMGIEAGGSSGSPYLKGARKIFTRIELLDRSYSIERQEKIEKLDTLLESDDVSQEED